MLRSLAVQLTLPAFHMLAPTLGCGHSSGRLASKVWKMTQFSDLFRSRNGLKMGLAPPVHLPFLVVLAKRVLRQAFRNSRAR